VSNPTRRITTALVYAALVAWLAAGVVAGCAGTNADFSNETDATSTTTTGGGMGGAGGSSTSGNGGNTGPCGTDCSLINTPQCQVAQCNVQTGQCEVVNDEEGVACDDGLFCTISDACSAGTCMGGPQNDCGMAPPQCTEVTCDETAQTCSTAPAMNGSACQDPNNLCMKGATCSNGLCIGGTNDDCFFFPVQNDCYVAVCDPVDGMCKEETGNEGQNCNDINDLCTVNKTCTTGVCQGGQPKDCSQLTVGCFDGVCDTMTGQCGQVAVMPGGMCQEATDQCNQGICDTMGMCNPQPANEGQSCNDNSFCTQGDVCQSGSCVGTSNITQCINGDFCCPNGCTINTDTDCNPTEYILSAVNRGWWNSTGAHTSGNDNTLTGQTSNQYNSYYSFQLTGIIGTVISGELRLEVEAYSSGDASETLSVWDVSTAATTLEASGTSTAIFNDLMTGNQYGTFTVLQTEVGQIKVIPLTPQAITDINNALGGAFSTGVHNDTVTGGGSQWVRFSAGSEARTHQLVVYAL
jgi:hypothetical protein